MNDNVAPGPRVWTIEGYIGGIPGELTSLFMPSLILFRDILDTAFFSRQIVPFVDTEFKSHDVMIAKFSYRKGRGYRQQGAG